VSIDRTTVVVMAKLPEVGRVKTRLQPALSAELAAGIHRALLVHLSERLSRMPWRRQILCYDRSVDQVSLSEFKGIPVAQSQGDLGARLAAQAARCDGKTLFFGCDSPDLPHAHLDRAAQLLAVHDVVIGPTDDGGYWCLGVSHGVDVAAMLSNIDWSSGREFAQTLERARSLGYNVALADPWDDVDRPEDLRRLMARLRKSDDPDDRALLDRLHAILPDGVFS
jgi:rSAM/selenodomain-associated transferase 1